MHLLIPAEALGNAFELVCCFATAAAAVVSYVFTLRF